jgi:hypothetical protein
MHPILSTDDDSLLSMAIEDRNAEMFSLMVFSFLEAKSGGHVFRFACVTILWLV